ncbi:helicase POLQ-like isoform X2 [Mytilus edulis]|uniref:helicase POLQ-like isoform X2 n=1 Tax=Mytilus edulis TaxID=6550 RepID=UPI0039EF29BF
MSAEVEKGPCRRVGKTRHKSSRDLKDEKNRQSKYFKSEPNVKSNYDINNCQLNDTISPNDNSSWFANSFNNERKTLEYDYVKQSHVKGNTRLKNSSVVNPHDVTDPGGDANSLTIGCDTKIIDQSHHHIKIDTCNSIPEPNSAMGKVLRNSDTATEPKDLKQVTVMEQKQKVHEDEAEDSILDSSDFLLADMDINWCEEKSEMKLKPDKKDINKEHVKTEKMVPVTPVNTLRDRIKQRLHNNAGVKTPQGPGSVIQQQQEKQLQKVQEEMERLKTKGSTSDIGPFYGLPSKVQQLLQAHRGISKLYDWQDECLNLPGVREGRNLIYSLPTSGGKTLVAEILILKQILCQQKDAIIILPFVSIVQEKVRSISTFALELDFLVEEYAGSKGRFPPMKRRNKRSLYIATIEKAHSLINSLIENNRLDSLGLVVVDELHMIGEGGSRGATLESTLLKIIHKQSNTQIIGMSATLNNIEDLQNFLKADVYHNDFRPVKLTEYIKLQDNIYEVTCKTTEDLVSHSRVVTFPYSSDQTKTDPDHLMGLVLEVIPKNSCLVFCPTKKNCENVAMMLCKMFVNKNRELCDIKKAEKKALLKELYSDGEQRICPVLQYTVHFGIAYHHSGLTMDERRLIEDAYSEGTLCLLACTSTLAAGVNLPAKRVILRSPYVGSTFLSRTQYKQMTGRAGRAGIDSSGESILITKSTDRDKVQELISGPNEMCYSSLMYDGGKGIRSLILSVIGLQVTKTTSDVYEFMRKTLLSTQGTTCDVTIVTKDSLQKLIELGLVLQKRSLSQADEDCDDFHLDVTPLGRATFKGSVDIDNASQLYNDLKKGEESLVLATYIHLLFLVTPYDMVDMVKPSWIIYFQQLSALDTIELKAASLIGVPESYIAMRASGQCSRQKVNDFVLNRFYLTLMLYELWKQKSLWEVADKFQQPRGFIQNLLSSAAGFASCVYHFCQELEEFWAYQDLLGNFVKRLSYCVTTELIPLMEIPGVKLGRAKQLHSSGYKTLTHVAHADPVDIVKHIKQISKKAAIQIVTSAKVLLNEKAEALREEVEELINVPEGSVSMTMISSQESDILPPTPDGANFSQESVT